MILLNSKKSQFLIKWVCIFTVALIFQICLAPLLMVKEISPNFICTIIILSALIGDLEISLPFALVSTLTISSLLHDHYFFFSWLILPFLAIYTLPKISIDKNIMRVLQVILCSLYVELINAFFISMPYGINFLLDNYWILLITPLWNGLIAIPLNIILSSIFNFGEQL